MRYEYRIVPAPAKGLKAKGLKTGEERFAHTLEEVLNEMAAEGWEYQRADTLPSQERSGLTSTVTEWRNVLVFRRTLEEVAVAPAPQPRPSPAVTATPATAALAADIEDTALRADAPASITPDADAPGKEEADQGKPPAFLSEPHAEDTADEDKADDESDKPKG